MKPELQVYVFQDYCYVFCTICIADHNIYCGYTYIFLACAVTEFSERDKLF